MKLGLHFSLILLISTALTASAQEATTIHLKEIDGRTWLIDAQGRPFFAHGVTHITAGQGKDVEAIGKACKELGFNAYGYGCAKSLRAELPYLEGRQLVPMSLYRTTDKSFGYVDVFDPEVQAKLEKDIKNLCMMNRNNPNLIGYCWTDLGAWPLENTTGRNWVKAIRDLPADAPGQRAYRAFLETWQGGDDTHVRDLAFLRVIARTYFRVLGEANRKYDPDHLVFGDRFTFQTAIPEVVEEMLPYVDAIAVQPRYQPGFPKKDFERLHKLSGKPIIICDFAIRFKEEGKNIRSWKPEETPEAAGERYAEYIREAFKTPYVIGAFWCNPINSTPGFSKAGIKQGLFDEGLTPRPELNRAIVELNKHLARNTPVREN